MEEINGNFTTFVNMAFSKPLMTFSGKTVIGFILFPVIPVFATPLW
jgi:hypothetical protein